MCNSDGLVKKMETEKSIYFKFSTDFMDKEGLAYVNGHQFPPNAPQIRLSKTGEY